MKYRVIGFMIVCLALASLCWGGVPRVIFTSPPSGALSVNTATTIDVVFSEAVDTSTITGSTFYLSEGLDTSTMNGTVELIYPTSPASTTSISLRPKNGLVKYMPYTVHLTTGIKSISTHDSLASPVLWSFATGTLVGTTSPVANAAGVPLTAVVKVQFNQDMNTSTIASGFTLYDKTSQAYVPGSVSYVNRTATFTPASPLKLSSTYTASLATSVKTVSGDGFASPFTWSFSTSLDTTPQVAVSSTYPEKDASAASVSTKIMAAFNQSMDVSTINGSTFTLSEGSSPVAGTVTYESSSNSAVFTPKEPLKSKTTYTATVASGVKNLTGRILASPFTWNFTTAAMSVKLSTLPDKAISTNEVLNVAGIADVNAGITMLLIDGNEATVRSDGRFSVPVVLAPGANPVSVAVTDTSGGTTTETRTITYDKTYPPLTVTAPPDHAATSQSFIDVNGTADASANVIIKDNAGNNYSASRSGADFSATVGLEWGMNTILIIAADGAGKITTAKRTVTYNSSGPGISIGTPAEDMKTSDTSVTLKGSISDTVSAPALELSIDGIPVDPPPAVSNGSFEYAAALGKEKTYAITATAVDQRGNPISTQRNIIYARYDLSDALKAAKVALGATPATPELLARYDVFPFSNGQPAPDGKIDVGDIVVIMKRIVGLLTW